MSQTVKFSLFIFLLTIVYIVIRLAGISSLSLTLWQSIYLGNVLKDTSLLFLSLILIRSIFISIKSNPKIGPTIISTQKLKLILYTCIALFWLSVPIHTIFDSLTIVVPLPFTKLYQFSHFMDETLSHLLMFLPIIGIFFVATILEIERPSSSLKNRELLFLGFLSIIMGTFMGINLTEGQLSLVTSFPLILVLLGYFIFLRRKYNLNFHYWSWGFLFIIMSTSASLGLTIWTLSFSSTPQLFTLIK